MSHHLFLVSKTLSLPATYNLYPGEGAGQASLQVKMTSVNAHFDDWEPPYPHQSFKGTPAAGLLCLPGDCSHLSKGSHGEGVPHPTPPPTPALCPCRPWLLSDRVGGGSHQSCQPGEGNSLGRAGVSKASSGRRPPRPAPSYAPEARHPAPTRKVVEPAPRTRSQHHGRPRAASRLSGTRRPPSAERPRPRIPGMAPRHVGW